MKFTEVNSYRNRRKKKETKKALEDKRKAVEAKLYSGKVTAPKELQGMSTAETCKNEICKKTKTEERPMLRE